MDTALSMVVVIFYVLLLTLVAVRARASHKFEEFSLARRALPLAMVFGSLAATYVGPGFSIAFVGRGFTSGFLFLGIGLAYSIQNILVGLFVAPRLRRLKNCHTLGDAIGQKYNLNCQIIAGIISVGICTFFSAVMAHAGGVVINDIFGWPQFYSALIIVAVTTLYTTSGGLRASVVTDAFQFAAFAILLPAALLWILVSQHDTNTTGIAQLASSIATQSNRLPTIEIVGLVAAFLLGETLIPPYTNRALASKTTGISRNGFIIAGLFSIAWFTVMVALGITARGIIPADTSEEHVLLVLFKSTMPAAGYTLLLLVLISVIMSSLDSLLNAGAVAFTQDIIKPFVKIKINDDASLKTGRIATVAIAAVAVACVPAVPSIIDGLLICYTIWASAILPAAIIGLWLKNPQPLAGFLSMVVGTISGIIAVAIVFITSFEIDAPVTIIPALGAALAAYLIGHKIGKRKAGV